MEALGPVNGSAGLQSAVSYPRPATLAAFVCAVLFIVIGVIGNLVTAVALLACPKLRGHATTTFILSLCVSDLLFCVLNLPLTASRYLHERWEFGHALCQLFPVIFYGNVAVSLLSMVAITINRYVRVAYFEAYNTIYSAKYICLQLLAIWAIAFGLMMMPLLGLWGQLGLDPATFSCTILQKNGHSPKKFLFFVAFLLPCFVITLSYSCIYWKVRRSKTRLETHSQLSMATSDQGKTASAVSKEREDSRLTTLMLSIFLCFVVSFLPLMIVNVADDDISFPRLHVLASIMAWASCVINPLIYAATNRQYRSAYKKLWNRFRRKPLVRRQTAGSRTFCQPSTNSGNSH